MHNYVSTNNVLPAEGVFLGPAYSTTPGQGPGWGWNASWNVSILPNLEQNALYNAYNFKLGADDNGNYTTGFAQIASLVCPSDSSQQRPSSPWAMTSYHGNHGGPGIIKNWSGTIVQNFTSFPAAWWGADSNMAYFGFESITDGTSNTAMISEKLLGIAGSASITATGASARRGFFLASYDGTYNTGDGTKAQTALGICKSLPGTTTTTNTYLSGAHWSLSYPWHTSNVAYVHFNTPNGLSCYTGQGDGNPNNPWGGTSAMITATSNHSGGVNVCMADGSVKFIKDSIAATTWWALGTRNGGEIISADAY